MVPTHALQLLGLLAAAESLGGATAAVEETCAGWPLPNGYGDVVSTMGGGATGPQNTHWQRHACTGASTGTALPWARDRSVSQPPAHPRRPARAAPRYNSAALRPSGCGPAGPWHCAFGRPPPTPTPSCCHELAALLSAVTPIPVCLRRPGGAAKSTKPWATVGNHRFEVHVTAMPQSGDVVRAVLPWARHDDAVENKSVVVLSASTSLAVNCSTVGEARPAPFASWSLPRALLTPQVNSGSLYRCGRST